MLITGIGSCFTVHDDHFSDDFHLNLDNFIQMALLYKIFFLIHIYSYNYVFRYDPKFVYHHTLLALILTEVRLDFDQ